MRERQAQAEAVRQHQASRSTAPVPGTWAAHVRPNGPKDHSLVKNYMEGRAPQAQDQIARERRQQEPER